MKWLGKTGSESIDSSKERSRMVQEQILARGIRDSHLLSAMERVPRHRFVSPRYRKESYQDYPLPIDHGQTISQPYIVAVMTEALQLKPGQRVLEIGTGSGYQTAVLAEMGMEVFSIEFISGLSDSAKRLLGELGYSRIQFRIGDGHSGWPDHSPYDGIIVTAAPAEFPESLAGQLKIGSRLVIPVGDVSQQLKVFTMGANGILSCENLFPVRFVPMVEGHEGNPDRN